MKTTIYTCSGDWTTDDLAFGTSAEVWWPEIKDRRPVTEEAQVEVALSLIGKTIVTVSPVIILTMLREVRVGRMSCADLEIHCNGKSIGVDVDGELINIWPGGFSRTRSHLLFHDD